MIPTQVRLNQGRTVSQIVGGGDEHKRPLPYQIRIKAWLVLDFRKI